MELFKKAKQNEDHHNPLQVEKLFMCVKTKHLTTKSRVRAKAAAIKTMIGCIYFYRDDNNDNNDDDEKEKHFLRNSS